MLHANDKYIVFLKDFCQNIINLSHPIMEKESIQSYYKNQQEINQLVKLKYHLRKHIISQIVMAGNSINGVNKYEPRANSFNDKRLVYYVSNKHKNLMITVVYENLLKDKQGMNIAVELQGDLLKNKKGMYIAVEMQGDLLKERSIFNQIEFSAEEKAIAFSDNFKNTNYNWSHFAVAHYHPSYEQVSNLSQFIIDKLKEDHLLSIFYKLDSFLDTYKTLK